jgi:hypothetical protein
MATQAQRKQMAEIHAKIVDAHRRGVCDADGHSVMQDGVMKARPRSWRPTQRWVRGVGWVEV